MTLAELKAELQNDPTARGYAAHLAAGMFSPVASLLNAIQPGLTVWRGVIDAYEIVGATDPTEWTSLSAAEKQRYQTLTGAGKVDTANANVRAAFAAMFPPGSTATGAALVALAQRDGSRAEQLWGAGTYITALTVVTAWRS